MTMPVAPTGKRRKYRRNHRYTGAQSLSFNVHDAELGLIGAITPPVPIRAINGPDVDADRQCRAFVFAVRTPVDPARLRPLHNLERRGRLRGDPDHAPVGTGVVFGTAGRRPREDGLLLLCRHIDRSLGEPPRTGSLISCAVGKRPHMPEPVIKPLGSKGVFPSREQTPVEIPVSVLQIPVKQSGEIGEP